MSIFKFLSQKGMTLTEVLIGAGLLGGVALVTAKLMSDQASNQNELKAKAEIAHVVLKLESILNNPANCKSMLVGKTVAAGGTALGTSGVIEKENILTYTLPNGEIMQALGEGSFPLYSIPDNGIRLQPSIYGPSMTDLVINFSMNGRAVYPKMIPIVTQLDATSQITSCGPALKDAEVVGQEKMCESLGMAATWDIGTKKCVLNEVTCPVGEVAIKMTSLGELVCKKLEEQVKLDELFDLSSIDCTGKQNLQMINDPVTGKFKLNCPGSAPGACVGNWGPCTSGTETYTISSPGTPACPFTNGATRSCGGPNVDCVGHWGPCMDATKTESYIVDTPASGTGKSCDFSNGQSRTCSGGTCYFFCSNNWRYFDKRSDQEIPVASESDCFNYDCQTYCIETGQDVCDQRRYEPYLKTQ